MIEKIEEIKDAIVRGATIHTLDSNIFIVATPEIYNERFHLIRLLTASKEDILAKLLYMDEKRMKKILLSVEIDVLKDKIRELENEILL
jgi:hypothetical protein